MISTQVIPLLHAEVQNSDEVFGRRRHVRDAVLDRPADRGGPVHVRLQPLFLRYCQVPSSSLTVLVSRAGKRVASGAELPLAAAEATLPPTHPNLRPIHPCSNASELATVVSLSRVSLLI